MADSYREAIASFADVALAAKEIVERDELLRLMARKMCELLGVNRCSLYLREENSALFRGQVAHPGPDLDSRVKRLTGGVEADGFTREIVRTRSPVVIADALRDSRAIHSTMREWGVRAMMGVPMLLRGQVIGLFFADAEEEAHRFTATDQEMALAFAELSAIAISQSERIYELRSGKEAVSRQCQTLRQAVALDDRFAHVVIGGGGLREIAEEVAELTKKTALICDENARPLVIAERRHRGRSRARAKIVPSPALAEAIAGACADGPSVIGPLRQAGINDALLVCPVIVRAGRRASLILIERGGPFSAVDKLVARRAAAIIALEMTAQNRIAQAEMDAGASLASDLIRGGHNISQVERRAEFLDARLDSPHVVCLLAGREGESPDGATVQAVVSFLVEADPDASLLTTETAEGVVLIVGLAADSPAPVGIRHVRDLLARACLELDPSGTLVAGVSSRCVGIADYAGAYEQARQVVNCIDGLSSPGDIHALSADDLGPGRLLIAGSNAEEAVRFAEEAIGALLGEKTTPELLTTLVTFFDCGRSVRRSATALEVHENTVRYRLSRIESLTGLDVAAAAEAQFSAQVALLVLRLKGVLPLQSAGRPPDDAMLN